jgi:LysM repeat protein
VYSVQPGDTVYEIASAYDMSVEDLLVANDMTEDDVFTIQPGDELIIPAPTPEGAPTATPAPAPATYTVRPGDTLVEIAQSFDVTVEELLEANDMTINDARTLQPGDALVLPGAEPVATPTAAAAATATTAPAATPTLLASAVRLDAPRLRSPENGASVSCSGQETLNWLATPSIRATDFYLVHLGYIESTDAAGVEEIVWVMTQPRSATTTSWLLDADLCGLAPISGGRQWRWYVEVAEQTAAGLQPVSPASAVWGFAWQ